jgi:hypothetical protein
MLVNTSVPLVLARMVFCGSQLAGDSVREPELNLAVFFIFKAFGHHFSAFGWLADGSICSTVGSELSNLELSKIHISLEMNNRLRM